MKKFMVIIVMILLFGLTVFQFPCYSQGDAEDLKPYIASVEQSKEGLTLWQLIQTGGFIMVVLAFLSFGAIALIVFNFLYLKTSSIAPSKFTEELIEKLEGKKKNAVINMCEAGPNPIARIVVAGINKIGKGRVFAREAMEDCTRKEIENLWQGISYLADIATIAPLIGLLGTVLGMIQAFNVIAFQTAVVKPILLAGGVSKAMVTTAGGLIVAIPVMILYSYFRGRVQGLANIIETHATDIIKLVEDL